MLRTLWILLVAIGSTICLGIPALTIAVWFRPSRLFDRLFWMWSWLILSAAGAKLVVTGLEHFEAQPHCFMVGNHQSALDIPALALITRGRVRFMAKKSLFSIPIIGWCMRFYRFVPVDRSSARQAKRSVDRMFRSLADEPFSPVVFPEGTRTFDGALGPFKHGTMSVCQKAGLPILPFAIRGLFEILRRNTLRPYPGVACIALGPALEANQVRKLRSAQLAAQLHREVQQLYNSAGSALGPAAAQVMSTEGAPQ